jgi:peptide/nickel transport system substrate-binding protein
MVDSRHTGRVHPKIVEAQDLLRRGRLDRRGFVRIAALLGMSAGAAYALAGLPVPAFAAEGDLPFAPDDPNAREGGILRVAMQVQKMEDPATFSWTQMSNQARQIIEYMTMTGPDNVTRPMLAERWEASDDLKTWTFHLRRGLLWHNGDEFNADDVVFNFERWCDPTLGSSNAGLSTFSAVLKDEGDKKVLIPGAIEKVDDHTVRLNLIKPVLSVAEDLYNYPTAIVHRDFKPPFAENPLGTGPYQLAEFEVGSRCILKRAKETSDGKPFQYWGGKVYLDEIHYFNFDAENQLTALASGDVDAIYEFGIEQLELARAIEGQIVAARTAQTLACRMRVTEAPFGNEKLRKAVQLGLDTSVYRELIFQGDGDEGEHHHVSPIHPEYFPLPKIERDVARARELLAEAGYPNGVTLTIDVGNTDGPWQQSVCEIMRDQLKDVGVTLNINVMPASRYWEIWDKTPFGATAWTHRPLGTMVMSLGYRSGAAWNESAYANPEFDRALDAAEAVLDVEERKKKMEVAERILQDSAVLLLPVWRPVYTMTSKQVHGYPPHPTQYHQFNKVWIAA